MLKKVITLFHPSVQRCMYFTLNTDINMSEHPFFENPSVIPTLRKTRIILQAE
jgi:hypothetical protein